MNNREWHLLPNFSTLRIILELGQRLESGDHRSRRHALIRDQIWGKSRTAPRKSFRTFTRDVKTVSESFPDNCPTFYVKIIFDKFQDLILNNLRNYFEFSLFARAKFSCLLSRRKLHFEDKIVDKGISSSLWKILFRKRKNYIRGVLSKVVEGAARRVLLN